MSNKDQYEYPEGASANKKFGMISKEGRTESLIPPFLKDPKIIAMVLGCASLFYLITHLLSFAVSSRTEKDKAPEVANVVNEDKLNEITNKIQDDNKQTAVKISGFSNKVENVIADSQDNAKHLRSHDTKISEIESKIGEVNNEIYNIKQSIDRLAVNLEKIEQLGNKKEVKKVKVVKKPIKIKLENFLLFLFRIIKFIYAFQNYILIVAILWFDKNSFFVLILWKSDRE